MIDMAQDGSLAAGVSVILREAIFGYDRGSRGVVVRSTASRVAVRFEATGHTLFVPRQLLERA